MRSFVVGMVLALAEAQDNVLYLLRNRLQMVDVALDSAIRVDRLFADTGNTSRRLDLPKVLVGSVNEQIWIVKIDQVFVTVEMIVEVVEVKSAGIVQELSSTTNYVDSIWSDQQDYLFLLSCLWKRTSHESQICRISSRLSL